MPDKAREHKTANPPKQQQEESPSLVKPRGRGRTRFTDTVKERNEEFANPDGSHGR